MKPMNYESIKQNDSLESGVDTTASLTSHEIHEHAPPPKTIGNIGSFSLVTNNICGPAMMSLPTIFRSAGIIPTTICILCVWLWSTLCGLFLSESFQKVKGNVKFDKNMNFASAFKHLAGPAWYVLVRNLVILSCMANAVAAIVETAQTLDGFLASFILGKTWALQVYPFKLLEWSPESCSQGPVAAYPHPHHGHHHHGDHHTTMLQSSPDSGTDGGAGTDTLIECVPFQDANYGIISLGIVLTTVMFYPLGIADLKETITVQLIAFGMFFLFFIQFMVEFNDQGLLYYNSIPLWGDDLTQLAGVVLFNYAYPITVPSWLNEKQTHVSTNTVIWGASSLSTFVYLVFGISGASAFLVPGSDMLQLLSSTQVGALTRLAAALFSLLIIGAGAPIFCVIIHKSLYDDDVMSERGSLFVGAVLPYILSLLMYQGTLLMVLLNWSGLIVNGAVAFILPLILTLYTYTNGDNNVKMATCGDNEVIDVVRPLPKWLEPARWYILITCIVAFSSIIVGTFVLDLTSGTEPS